MWGAGPRCRAVPRGATRCHAFWGPTWGRLVAAQHQVGRRRSAPADLEGGGHSRDPRLHPKSCPPPLVPCPQDLAQPRSLSPWPRAAGGPVGTRGAEPCRGTQVAFKSMSPPLGANDNQELIMAMAWGQRGQHRGPALPRPPPACPCPRSPGASPGGSCPTPRGGTWGGGFGGPSGGFGGPRGVAVAAGCPPWCGSPGGGPGVPMGGGGDACPPPASPLTH